MAGCQTNQSGVHHTQRHCTPRMTALGSRRLAGLANRNDCSDGVKVGLRWTLKAPTIRRTPCTPSDDRFILLLHQKKQHLQISQQTTTQCVHHRITSSRSRQVLAKGDVKQKLMRDSSTIPTYYTTSRSSTANGRNQNLERRLKWLVSCVLASA